MKLSKSISLVLSDIASLANPTTALALVALVAQIIPGISIPGATLAGILAGVGVIAGFVQRLLAKSGGNVLGAAKLAVADIALLRNPAAAAALVALVVQLIPGVQINGQAVAGILGAVGVVASFVAAQIKLSHQTPAPAPAPPASK